MEPGENQKSLVITPTILSCYRNGWRQMKHYFLDVLLLIAIALVLFSLSGLPLSTEYSQVLAYSETRQISLFAILYVILVYGPLSYGISYAFLKAARGEQPEVSTILEVLKNYTSAVMARLLVFTIIGLGIGLLLIPGLIFGCRLAFVPYLVVEEQMDSIESVKMSWRMTRGLTFTIIGFGLVAVLIYLAGLIALGVGIILSAIWVKLTFASLYHAVAVSSDEIKNYDKRKPGEEEIDGETHHFTNDDVKGRLRNMLDENEDKFGS